MASLHRIKYGTGRRHRSGAKAHQANNISEMLCTTEISSVIELVM
ncbi:hypothetical protein RHECNPAF_4310026 [Rhizobium etli CNPAF512]|nr:hypothetical protein RHECNPAF_4310026 [Rhizobium etli CNPAF512]